MKVLELLWHVIVEHTNFIRGPYPFFDWTINMKSWLRKFSIACDFTWTPIGDWCWWWFLIEHITNLLMRDGYLVRFHQIKKQVNYNKILRTACPFSIKVLICTLFSFWGWLTSTYPWVSLTKLRNVTLYYSLIRFSNMFHQMQSYNYPLLLLLLLLFPELGRRSDPTGPRHGFSKTDTLGTWATSPQFNLYSWERTSYPKYIEF